MYLQKEEAIRKSERTAKSLHPAGKAQPGEESSSKKRKEVVCAEGQNQFPNTSLSTVFIEARKDPDFKPSPKMRTPPTMRSNQKYYEYHRDHGRWTEECISLKKEVEILIQRGKLREFVAKGEGIGNCSWKSPQEKEGPRRKLTTLEILKGLRINK
jgi:hypothetical protein